MASILKGLTQRLGRLDPAVAALAGRSAIWLHAASVGEVLSAEPLVELLHRDEPTHPLFVTTTSITGRDTARSRLGLPATLLPLDFPPLVDAVIRRMAPAALVLVETEIWPGLIRAAAHAGVPILIVSARISARAAERYARVRPLVASALSLVSHIAAQTQADADRFVALGARPERVQVLGSLKLARHQARNAPPRPVWLGERAFLVAASTQPGEEAAVLDACSVLWQAHPNALLVLAPRRPERFAEVMQMLERRGLRWSRRTDGAAAVPTTDQVFLLDTIGELASYFSGARAAFVGGTLAPIGGHNILEPASYGVPVAFGPHLDNVTEAAALLRRTGGGSVVANPGELRAFWSEMLDDPDAARERGRAAVAEIERCAEVADQVAKQVRGSLRISG